MSKDREEATTSPNRTIRVLQLITRMTVGGDTRAMVDMSRYFANLPDFDAKLAAGPVGPWEEDLSYWAADEGLELRIIPTLSNRLNPLGIIRAVIALVRLCRSERFDIVHSHGAAAGIVGRLAAWLARVPIRVHHVHGWGFQPYMARPTKALVLSLERFCARRTDRLIAVSSQNLEKGLANKIGDARLYQLIHYGLDLDKLRVNVDRTSKIKSLGIDPSDPIVGMVGRLIDQKNPLDFIRVANAVHDSIPEAKFLIVGDGPLRGDCERLIAELGLNEVCLLLGYRDDVPELMQVLAVTAMTSLWEGLPFVFIESLTAGVPVVANDVDGAADAISDGRNGFLVAPHQPQVMASRITTILSDPDLASRMSEAARNDAEHFSLDRFLGDVHELYLELLKEKGIA